MSTDDLDQISRLFRLRESGALSEQEFDAEKNRILKGDGDATGAPVIEARKPSLETRPVEQDEIYHEPPAERSKWWIGLLVLVVLVAGIGAAWFIMRSSTGVNEQQAAAKPSAHLTAPPPVQAMDSSAVPSAHQDQASLYQWATSTEALGVTPEFLASNLGPARESVGATLDFSVAGCDVKYQIENKTVAYLDAELSGSCTPSLKGLNAASSINLPHASTLAQVQQGAGGLIIADCLEMCGNAADPAQYLFIEGPHADNFVNIAMMADPKASAGTQKWASAIRATHSLTPDAVIPAQAFECGTDAQETALQEVGPNRISRIIVGAGLTKEKLTQCGVDTE